jgi:hypothetical protein
MIEVFPRHWGILDAYGGFGLRMRAGPPGEVGEMTMTYGMQPPVAGAEVSRRGFDTKSPRTRLGRVSMWLGLAFIIGFALNSALVGIVGTSTDPVVNAFSRTYLPYWGVALMGTGFFAGIVGLVAILKDGERSILALLTLVPTVFVTLFLLGELLIPH